MSTEYDLAWKPYCGVEYPGPVAGEPVICDRNPHDDTTRHCNAETGFQWWSFQSYPRT